MRNQLSPQTVRRAATLSVFPATGAAAVLAFPPIEAYTIAWVALVPLMATIEDRPWFWLFGEGYLYGLGFYGTGLMWLPDAIGSFTTYDEPVSWGAFAAIIGFLSLFPAIFRWLMRYVQTSSLRLLVFAPALWLTLDNIRQVAWGGLPWLDFGASQLPGPLASAYPLIGEPGVTIMLVLINGCVVALAPQFRDRSVRWRSACATALAVVVMLGTSAVSGRFDWTAPVGNRVHIGILDTRIEDLHQRDLKQRDSLQERYRSLVASLQTEFDLLVLPEAAIGPKAGTLYRALSEAAPGTPAVLTGSLGATIGGARTNRAILHTATDAESYRKQRLVPFAEERDTWLAGLVLPASDSPLLAGSSAGALFGDRFDLALAICWEIRFGSIIAQQIREGAGIIVNPANESWLRSAAAARRSVAIVGVRAAEYGRPTVRVTNSGPSAYFDPTGQLQWSAAGRDDAVRRLTLQPHAGRTPYHALRGDTVLRSVAAAMVALLLAHELLGWNRRRRTAVR